VLILQMLVQLWLATTRLTTFETGEVYAVHRLRGATESEEEAMEPVMARNEEPFSNVTSMHGSPLLLSLLLRATLQRARGLGAAFPTH
jgi:hypothetical protein